MYMRTTRADLFFRHGRRALPMNFFDWCGEDRSRLTEDELYRRVQSPVVNFNSKVG
jgi:hypothetical protein